MPTVAFMPYFPDRQINATYGDFKIWNWKSYKADYIADASALKYLEDYFRIYKRPDRKPEDRITVISTGSKGALPESLGGLKEKIGRFASAAMLAHLALLPSDSDGGLFASSSDNFVVYFQPFDVSSTMVALEFGSYFRTQVTGSGFERLDFMTPQHVPDPGAALVDDELLKHLAGLCPNNSTEAGRIFRSLDWVRSAFTNADEYPYESRIVAMSTAFEILLDMPEDKKGMHFSKLLNDLLPANKLPTSARPMGRSGKLVSDNDVGWWCRDFYALRSRIVHGNEIQRKEYLVDRGEKLKIALYLFVEGIWGLLRKMGIVTEIDGLSFWIRADKWMNMLKLPRDAFY